ncbi:polysaccharide biosynthesis tyrosine autokinase [Ichthyenterobacterium sp. W332]|uniref:non-specific protein-tyrosine kinase n=1 Tax=Microcosmobacter mediterraneus TaxID=3075607 RepID=A0ABU2YMH8_9FLAO|nr:polysaccharide biosynthesis tyrosine autokinase [Ichthyenterobacterium sp. W332]MDT0559372.1 polysaccharide biosynthesis tyrosine autokinase [Ichthyenterobacterium sp. W332]
MSFTQPQYNFSVEDDSLDITNEIKRYLRFWPWFLLALILSFIVAHFYLKYTTSVYQTTAKIKILDESEGLELPTSAFVFKRVNINLENEIEILKSYLILEKVAKSLKLTSSIFEEGTIQTSQVENPPFFYEQTVSCDSIFKSVSYQVDITENELKITNLTSEKVILAPNHNTLEVEHRLPFEITMGSKNQLQKSLDKRFIIKLKPLKTVVLNLKSQIKAEPIGEQSDLLELAIKSQSKNRSETILDTLISVFDFDGVTDRRSVSLRTMEFIEERFKFLSVELDSIEDEKKEFKRKSNLVYLETDAELSLQQRTASDSELFKIENQIALSELLSDALRTSNIKSDLLPADIGIDNERINQLINEYNTIVLERDKFMVSGGENNPSVGLYETKLKELRSNIDRSIISFGKQLQLSKNQLVSRNQQFKGQVSALPQKEQLLRSIERNQKIKESLYLFLLQKQEESAINYAITEPSIKVVENAISNTDPISPKSNIIYAGAFLSGLLLPFGILYLMFMLNNKLQSKEDIDKMKSDVSVIGEIPKIKEVNPKIFEDPNDRSILAESFRILSSNVNFILGKNKDEKGKVIYCTSTIKGEGKTYISVNLSLALSSLNKKVLLIGADLRNPQIHSHIKVDKGQTGLTNLLYDVTLDWKNTIIKGFDKHHNHHTIISGPIPPNPAHLLTNGNFENIIEEAKDLYDYIIVDTAPTILVTDTMLISDLADATIYIARANFTEKNLLNFSKDLSESGKLKNMAYVLNGVGANKSYNYSYNYGYGYGYGGKS